MDDPSGRREDLPPRHERDPPPRQQPRSAEPQVFYNLNPTSLSMEVLHREGYDNRGYTGNVDHSRSLDRVQERVGRRLVNRVNELSIILGRSSAVRTAVHSV